MAVDLAGNEFGDAGAAAVARAGWQNLTCLDLGENGITAEGARALAAWQGLAKLAYLDLGGNPIGLEGAKALAACKALKKCRKIVVPYDEKLLPAEGLELLRTAFGRRIDY